MWQGYGILDRTKTFQVGYIYQYINTDGGNVYLSVSANTDAVYPSIITVMVSETYGRGIRNMDPTNNFQVGSSVPLSVLNAPSMCYGWEKTHD